MNDYISDYLLTRHRNRLGCPSVFENVTFRRGWTDEAELVRVGMTGFWKVFPLQTQTLKDFLEAGDIPGFEYQESLRQFSRRGTARALEKEFHDAHLDCRR